VDSRHACADDAGTDAVQGEGVEGSSSGEAGNWGVIGGEACDGNECEESFDGCGGGKVCNGIEKGESGAAAGSTARLESGKRTSSSSYLFLIMTEAAESDNCGFYFWRMGQSNTGTDFILLKVSSKVDTNKFKK
jgi:hypothetical protein